MYSEPPGSHPKKEADLLNEGRAFVFSNTCDQDVIDLELFDRHPGHRTKYRIPLRPSKLSNNSFGRRRQRVKRKTTPTATAEYNEWKQK